MSKQINNKGFTLVELSIVLVIIGLLIGGILVAQSMINTTKIQALIRQTGSFDAAVANFYTKYNGLPGDTKAVYSSGDGDGYISSAGATSGTCTNTTTDGEIANFWYDLSISGLSTDGAGGSNATPNTYAVMTGVAMSSGGATATSPKAKAGSNNAGFLAACSGAIGNFYILIDAAQASGTSNAWSIPTAGGQAALKSVDALAIDTKLDDGNATTGNVQSVQPKATTALLLGTTLALTGCPAAATYDVSKNSLDCDIAIRIGINTGNLQ